MQNPFSQQVAEALFNRPNNLGLHSNEVSLQPQVSEPEKLALLTALVNRELEALAGLQVHLLGKLQSDFKISHPKEYVSAVAKRYART